MSALQFKNSILCSFKGFFIFNVAALSTIQYSLFLKFFNHNTQDHKKYDNEYSHAFAQVKRHIIPFSEVLIVMPIVFLLCNLCSAQATPLFYSACLGICIAIMIAVCFTLRRLNIVSDCCSAILHPIYSDSIFIKFSQINPQKSCCNNIQSNTEQYSAIDPNISNTSHSYLKFYLFLLLTLPIKILLIPMELSLAILNIIELPFSFIFDIINNCKSPQESAFHESKANLVLSQSFFLAFLKDIISVLTLGISELIRKNKDFNKTQVITKDTTIEKSISTSSLIQKIVKN
ncbi:hypothetical protein [Candidatus Neoehrlichia procyonis]|uniref:Putative membrane protein n=1 Tax=Candidatus Neoehrlichia procyonis str. RAC413 TaxID=1359163 RepID=A0A0F3NLZ9_9RICK|nr:hypothetical protein [Candidatus Neoehrlichia lotoris]KJV69073.1 putative membrane protein [Candidatus Neoehrlichia lotoris str. RAC413]